MHAPESAVVREGNCRENVISGLTIDEPGAYNLWLSEIEILARSSGKSIQVDRVVLPWVVEWTQEDLDRGTATVAVPPGGIFRMTAVDSRHVPIPRHKMIVGADQTTIEFQMHANGTQVVYGNPTLCVILIDPGTGVLIEHLDIAAL
jgi:hypothetical protein